MLLSGVATQSSEGWGGKASRAVDGNAATLWGSRSCTSTNTEDNPWWRMDLPASQTVALVRVTNRGEGIGPRLDLFTIEVGDQECGSNLVVPDGDTGDFFCNPPLIGTNVSIKLPGKQRILTVSRPV